MRGAPGAGVGARARTRAARCNPARRRVWSRCGRIRRVGAWGDPQSDSLRCRPARGRTPKPSAAGHHAGFQRRDLALAHTDQPGLVATGRRGRGHAEQQDADGVAGDGAMLRGFEGGEVLALACQVDRSGPAVIAGGGIAYRDSCDAFGALGAGGDRGRGRGQGNGASGPSSAAAVIAACAMKDCMDNYPRQLEIGQKSTYWSMVLLGSFVVQCVTEILAWKSPPVRAGLWIGAATQFRSDMPAPFIAAL